MRIVHCFRAPVGGVFRHVRDLAEAQAAAGHAVGIVCDSITGGPHEENLLREISERLDLGLWRLPMRRQAGFGDIGAAWNAYKQIRNMRPDILHGHGAKGGLYSRLIGTAIGRTRRVGRFYSPHGGSLHYDERSFKGRLYFGAERLMERVSDRLFFVCDYEKQTYARKVGIPVAETSIAYNGLRPEEFEDVPAAADARDLLFIGTMRDLKGPDIFIDALASIQGGSERSITAAMVGDGELLPLYRDQVARLGLVDQVSFLPAMDARKAFALARLVVVPSRAESFPYIVLEALAAGKPVIASNVGGIPEIFADQPAALIEPNAVSLARRLIGALSDPGEFRLLMPSKRELQHRFAVSEMSATILDGYRRSLGL